VEVFAMTQSPQITTTAVATPAVAHAETVHTHGGFRASVKRLFAFLAWVLTGFGLIGLFVGRRRRGAHRAE
jgi:hypothetical protein